MLKSLYRHWFKSKDKPGLSLKSPYPPTKNGRCFNCKNPSPCFCDVGMGIVKIEQVAMPEASHVKDYLIEDMRKEIIKLRSEVNYYKGRASHIRIDTDLKV